MSNAKLDTFQKAKEALLEEYKEKSKELAAMRKQLIAVGVLEDESTAATVPTKAKRKGGKRVKLEDEAVIKFLAKPGTAGDLEKEFGCSYQSAGAKLKELAKAKKLTHKKEGLKVFYTAA